MFPSRKKQVFEGSRKTGKLLVETVLVNPKLENSRLAKLR